MYPGKKRPRRAQNVLDKVRQRPHERRRHRAVEIARQRHGQKGGGDLVVLREIEPAKVGQDHTQRQQHRQSELRTQAGEGFDGEADIVKKKAEMRFRSFLHREHPLCLQL